MKVFSAIVLVLCLVGVCSANIAFQTAFRDWALSCTTGGACCDADKIGVAFNADSVHTWANYEPVTVYGVEGISEACKGWWKLIPTATFTELTMTSAGDQTFVHWTWGGTCPSNGKVLKTKALAHFTTVGDKASNMEIFGDLTTFVDHCTATHEEL